MGKQGKSSASSATRKKHARKAAAVDPSIAIAPAAKSQGKGKGKGKNKEPRVKQYIPPPKYKPLVEDPIESLAISSILPSNMVLCFKGLSKKDSVTKAKALEELGSMLNEESWKAALPVWLWHFVPLSVHPSRRLRELNATLHSRLLDRPIREELQSFILGDPSAGSFLAAWALGSNDTVSTVAHLLKSSWNSNISWRSDSLEEQLIEIQDHVEDMVSAIVLAVIDPGQLYRQFAPLLARATKDATESSDATDFGENTQDRDARIRTAALNTLGWILEGSPTIALPSLLPVFGQLLSSNHLLGTILSASAQPSFLSSPTSTDEQNSNISWGHGQRGVRIAGWSLVKIMVKYLQQSHVTDSAKDAVSEAQISLKSAFLSNLGIAALRSAWVETDAGVRSSMWEGILPLITVFSEVWNAAPMAPPAGPGGHDTADSDDDEEDGVMETTSNPDPSEPTKSSGELAYADFLHFLEIGCHGSAAQSYPAIVVVLSTLPATILPYDQENLERFFVSFWAAYDGKALNVLPRDKEPTLNAFLSSLLECIVFISRKLHMTLPQSQNSGSSMAALAGSNLKLVPINWIANILTELVGGDLARNISEDAAGALVGGSIRKLELINSAVTEQAWVSSWEPVFFNRPRPGQTGRTIKLLAAMGSATQDGQSGKKIDAMLQKIARMDFAEAENVEPLSEQAQILTHLWEYLELARAPWLVKTTSDLLKAELMEQLVRSGNSRGITYLLNGFINAPNTSLDMRQVTWVQFVSAVIHTSGFEILRNVLESVRISLPYPNEDASLYALCKSWIIDAGQGESDHVHDIVTIIVHRDICLSQSQALDILELIMTTFVIAAKEQLLDPADVLDMARVVPFARILTAVLATDKSHEFWNWPGLDLAEVGAILLLLSGLPDQSTSNSRDTIQYNKPWELWSLHASSELKSVAYTRAKELIRSLLSSCATALSVSDVIVVAQSALHMDETTFLSEIIPSQRALDQDLDNLNDNPSLVLAEADPLVKLDEREPNSVALLNYDRQGFSKYARLGSALTRVLTEDRHLAREKLWTFKHLLALQQLCSDFISASFWPSDVFRQGSENQVRSLLDVIAPLVIYLGNSLLVDHPMEWHEQMISRLQGPNPDFTTPQNAQDIVYQLHSIAIQTSPSNCRDSRLLRRIMQFILRDVESDVLDIWSGFAQSIYGQYPQAADAIASVLAARGIESNRLDRWRNEVASRIPGVPMDAINKTGLPLLRTLNCLAPPPDSGIIFLPQQRAVFLVQSLQKWMSSDEDLDASLELRITITLNHLLPILQTVLGAHWEFIFDVLENNLAVEGSATNLYLLLQTLKAISSIQELVQTNRTLKDVWKSRQHDIFQGVVQMFLAAGDDKEESEARSRYNACLAGVIQTLPPEQIQADLFAQLMLLTSSRSIPIKTASHHLARNALARITEQRVLDAAVNTLPEGDEQKDPLIDAKFELPQILIEKLTPPLTNPADSMDGQVDLLLSWWIALEFFDNSSLKVKQGYTDQLRKLNLVKTSLLPCLFSLLKIGVVGEKPFNLAPWSVEEFYLNLYDASLECVPNVLAAHIYFKALRSIPGLIRTWYSECQDRQLSSSLSSYTKSHFSPVLIKQELVQFRSAATSASESLSDDNFSLKVAPSVNEISASYTVDEQEGFEVSIRLPSEFPLRAAEVKDVRGVAGMENRRRAWVFGVQNAVQQGLIYDALVMYKRNVTGHFEGKSECAICYSLISVTDRTLPTKPCRTCKNLFHASCLYKWFNTSHTSTCPLCRSDIF